MTAAMRGSGATFRGGLLDGGELGVAAQPGVPAAGEALALPLATEHRVEMAAIHTQFASGDGRAWEPGLERLVRDFVHESVVFGACLGLPSRVTMTDR